jgi:uncharacterized membrane protein
MPGMEQLETLSRSYGLALAVLILAAVGLLMAVVALYRKNEEIHKVNRDLLLARIETLEVLAKERVH